MEMHRYDYSSNNKVGVFFELRNRLRSFFENNFFILSFQNIQGALLRNSPLPNKLSLAEDLYRITVDNLFFREQENCRASYACQTGSRK